ncbi:MAG: MmgE/PrpD family protein [Lawsonibacter sp.]
MGSSLRDLARFAVNLNVNEIPDEVRKNAAMRILDSVAAGIGASTDPQVQHVTAAYRTLCGDQQAAPVWAHGFRAPIFTAAFLNGLQGHTLELDDVHTKSKAHIGTVVVPAAWSCAAMLGSNGEELLAAVTAAYEITARIAMAFGVKEHRKPGWHSTATAGVFGAAAACGKLLGFDENTMVNALGLAGAQSFGTWAFLADGASCKVLNPARAAQSGCEAAFLAKAGMSGPEHVLTSEDGGLFHMMTTKSVPEYTNADLGSVWEICTMDNKPYPCCRSTHCGIDGALAIRERDGITAVDVDHVVVDTYQIGNQQCGTSKASREPHTPPQAKFSTPYCVAAALLHGKVGLQSFEQAAINGTAEQDLLRRVEIRSADRFTAQYPRHWGCHVTVFCKDGRVLEQEVPDASGSVDSPLTLPQARSKAVGLMSGVLGEHQANKLADTLLMLEQLKNLPDLTF